MLYRCCTSLQEFEEKVWARIKENAINTAVLQQKITRLEQLAKNDNRWEGRLCLLAAPAYGAGDG